MKHKPLGRCQLWTGALNSDGYPVKKIEGVVVLITRLVLSLKLGRAIKRKHEAAHLCHVRNCICEDHLVEAKHRDNCRMVNPRRAKRRAA